MEKDLLPVGEVPDRPYSIRDESDSFSLINFLSEKLKRCVMDLPEEYLLLSEGELREKCDPTSTDYALRVSFWREFEKMMWRGNGKIVCASVFGGICSEVYFYKKFMVNEAKLAWMIRPMQTYQKEMEAILYRGTERLWELVEINIKNKKGQVDAKLAEVLLKAVKQVEDRVKGMAVQRSEQRSLSVNVTTRSKATQSIDTMDQLDARIKQLEEEVDGENPGEVGAGDNQTLQVEAPKEERQVITVGVLRSPDPVSGQ